MGNNNHLIQRGFDNEDTVEFIGDHDYDSGGSGYHSLANAQLDTDDEEVIDAWKALSVFRMHERAYK